MLLAAALPDEPAKAEEASLTYLPVYQVRGFLDAS
jgi:hypothetical protein